MEEKLACTVECNNVRKLIMFYAHMMRVPDLWRCLGVKKVYEVTLPSYSNLNVSLHSLL